MRVFFDVQAIKKTLVSMEFDLEKMPRYLQHRLQQRRANRLFCTQLLMHDLIAVLLLV